MTEAELSSVQQLDSGKEAAVAEEKKSEVKTDAVQGEMQLKETSDVDHPDTSTILDEAKLRSPPAELQEVASNCKPSTESLVSSSNADVAEAVDDINRGESVTSDQAPFGENSNQLLTGDDGKSASEGDATSLTDRVVVEQGAAKNETEDSAHDMEEEETVRSPIKSISGGGGTCNDFTHQICVLFFYRKVCLASFPAFAASCFLLSVQFLTSSLQLKSACLFGCSQKMHSSPTFGKTRFMVLLGIFAHQSCLELIRLHLPAGALIFTPSLVFQLEL